MILLAVGDENRIKRLARVEMVVTTAIHRIHIVQPSTRIHCTTDIITTTATRTKTRKNPRTNIIDIVHGTGH